MKKTIFFFLLLLSSQIYSQTYKYAILSNLNEGNVKSTEKISKIIFDINSNKEISFAVIIGNLTANGKAKELDSVKQILRSLKTPYLIIPGNNTKASNNSLSHFKELWNNTNFFYKKDNDIHIGLNSIISWNGKGGHFSPEDLDWLNEMLNDSVKNKSDSSNIILYLSNLLNKNIDNWFKASNILSSYNIKAVFTSEGETNKLAEFDGIPGASVLPVSGETKYPGYFIIESNKDSLIISQVETGRKRSENILHIISKEKHYVVSKIDSLQFIDYTNSVKWQKDLDKNIPASIETTDNKIFAASEDGYIYCYDLNGNKIWEYNTGETIISKPAAEGDVLLAATLEGDLFSINSNNGNVIQVIGLGEPLTSQLFTVDAENQGSKTKGVVAGTSTGEMFCYDIYTLENIWENNSAKDAVTTLPLYIKNRIIYGSNDGFIYCIDSRSGILNWKWKDKNSGYSFTGCSPVSNGKYVYISSPGNYIYAIDLLLGTAIWKTKDFQSWESLGISNDNEKLFIKGLNNFYIASAQTGKLIKEIKIDYNVDTSPVKPIEWDNNILFGAENGIVYLIDQNYNWKKLFFAGTARLNNVNHIKDSIFCVSNIDGNVVVFTLN
ncbi:MAG: PQQ-binding-like beta-propeller repeat protein [Ignavibacteriaceae bacterium]